MEMMSSKKEKEKWVINEFLLCYNKIKESDYSPKMIEEEGKPDSLIANSKGEKLGLEVTEYHGFPCTKAGEQKAKEDQFENIMNEKLSRYKNFSFDFCVPSFPTKRKEMEYLCEGLAREIENSISISKEASKETKEVKFDNVVVCFGEDSYRADRPRIIISSFSEGVDSGGTQEIEIKNSIFKGLYELIKKKANDAKKYRNEEENILVIRESDYSGGFVKEQMGEIAKLLKEKFKKEKGYHVFKEIWILDDGVKIEIYQVY